MYRSAFEGHGLEWDIMYKDARRCCEKGELGFSIISSAHLALEHWFTLPPDAERRSFEKEVFKFFGASLQYIFGMTEVNLKVRIMPCSKCGVSSAVTGPECPFCFSKR